MSRAVGNFVHRRRFPMASLRTIACLLTLATAMPAVLGAALSTPPTTSFDPSDPYGQCGGINWTGTTTCQDGWYCLYLDPERSFCLPDGVSIPEAPGQS
ncbi:carbohydrate-binding module family 1 protein [Auriscalpium vulgare]|uniref:Carbohydrate-binding module family 1 protein n=1 Tax=Auriscalpium vulgare TaxID=40419 RepID=A0ACB8RAZ3_9AGAM|nr:carbohydrate-binding module family 1 protein [Auriscalpium vulgare]